MSILTKKNCQEEKGEKPIILAANQSCGMTRVYVVQPIDIAESDQYFEQLIKQSKEESKNV